MSAPVPKIVSVDVVATRPTDTDRSMSAELSAETGHVASDAAFIVRIRLETIPPATGEGWALYVGDTRIPKYWEYPGGIYVKVLDEEFLAEHQGEKLRFSQNGEDFIDTGMRLPGPRAGRATVAAATLPTQEDVLNEGPPARTTRKRATAKRATAKRAATKRATMKRARLTSKKGAGKKTASRPGARRRKR
jgi:hypothetical protein